MTREQFIAEYRRRLLGFMTECYALRRMQPSEFGLEVDRQMLGLNTLLKEMYESVNPTPPPEIRTIPAPHTNGTARQPMKN